MMVSTTGRNNNEAIAGSSSIEKNCCHKRLNGVLHSEQDVTRENKKRKLHHACLDEESSHCVGVQQTALPDPKGPGGPDGFLAQLVQAEYGLSFKVKPAAELKNFYHAVTKKQVDAYTNELVSVARNNDVSELRSMSNSGHSLNCSNRFGESLLHLACRRGFEDMVELLTEQPSVSVRVADDGGRNPLHDTCWNPSPQLHICKLIMERDPTLFFISDGRGFTPFDYARPEHWSIWKQFLLDNRGCLRKLTEPSISSLFSC
jgi:ankyrin repeat protein